LIRQRRRNHDAFAGRVGSRPPKLTNRFKSAPGVNSLPDLISPVRLPVVGQGVAGPGGVARRSRVAVVFSF
jgi:hypothetical protein